jgi:hypothetical protein
MKRMYKEGTIRFNPVALTIPKERMFQTSEMDAKLAPIYMGL